MPPEGMRRSSRIPQAIGILLVGSDMEGKMFSEETSTVLLSRHGAGIISHYKLSPEQELILRRLDTNKETEVRVVGQIGAESGVYTYGVAFLDATDNFWGIDFPPPSEDDKEARTLRLECGRCKASETVEQSDLESDVYLINEGIVRFCKQCGSSTLWKRGSQDAPETEERPAAVEILHGRSAGWVPNQEEDEKEKEKEKEAPAPVVVAATPEPAPAPPEPAPLPANRRKHTRTKVSFKACIRSFAHGDHVVVCEDFSRGGMRFKSKKPYTVNFRIEVAAPYTPGLLNLFVPAEIVRVEELEGGKMFLCGVAFLKDEKRR